jgi:hypothetical protein
MSGGKPCRRRLKDYARSGHVWLVRITGQCYQAYFWKESIFEDAKKAAGGMGPNLRTDKKWWKVAETTASSGFVAATALTLFAGHEK